jgi:hydrogenase large subunit
MKLSPEVNLLAVAHYLQALDYQRRANQVVAILGGKTPNIQNLAVGGVANAINLDNDSTLNMSKLFAVKEPARRDEGVHRAGVFRRRLRDRRDVRDWAQVRQRRDQLSGRARPADRHEGTQFDLPGGTIFKRGSDAGQIDHLVRGPLLSEERVGVHHARLVRR